ncbi:membrane fusion protein, multidrug efflux system [Luteibacter sp. UNCMF331Sha3.1]|uniref:HlyD family efflux transporter periplasmic adaptor subunit n=1 Tax=Luteibacter sp. UNCMF331Sha3.1 TaxID=1502760 RepID=UPI0008B435EF|nr:HlyD family efflux transporter periplasmic adaptor subunit [Luteibacter sp. UNCMF331Sha3.1]SEM57469.1 membrane fusion protein, multidrug efflux system [Luteibacter sp. UNCMF331Sha3.1]
MSQENTAPAGAVVVPPPKSRRGFFLKLLVLVLVLAGIGWTVWYFVDGRWYEDTDDAYVNGNVVQITPQIAATVLSITADDGDLVHKGDLLVKLDDSDAQIAVLSARAELANTVRRVRGLYNNVTSAQADVSVRQTAVDRARADYNRRRDLAKSGAISAEELSHALDTLTSAEGSLASARQSYSTSKVLVDDTVVASHPDVRAAAAKLRSAYLDLARSKIVAPVDGYVAKRSVQLGQRVQPGAALMAVVPLHEVWIDANFKETQLTHMRIGQPVDVTADVYGSDIVYKATIRSLGIGSGSAFSLLPAQNATGNWIKIVQRVPVRVVFTDPKQLDQKPLRLGLSTKVTVSLHDQGGALLAQKSPAKPEFSTDVYDHRLDGVDDEIAKVIHENASAGEGEQQKAPK